jgi:hypothetical protein
MNDKGWMCTHCPTPCQECRVGGTGPFCEKTPCDCDCHDHNYQYSELRTWYKGPLNKDRLSELRYKLARARGLLVSFISWEVEDKELVPTTQDVKDILKETEDP